MVPRHPKVADRHYTVGEEYCLVEHFDRSINSHRHYFICLAEGWKNLPDDLAIRYPTSEHLRKAALIAAGYRDERTIVAASKAEALRIAAFIRPMDEHAIVSVNLAVVRVWTAQSQSTKAMDRRTFQASKDAVLDYVAGLIGTTRDRLNEAGRTAA